MKPSFLNNWKDFKRALSQRNLLLRQNASTQEIETWNQILSEYASALGESRETYVLQLNDALQQRLVDMALRFHVELRYRQGWDTTMPLYTVLSQNIQYHRRLKTTTDGPHRADLIITSGSSVAKQVLSRGEQKVLVYALHLAQLDVLRQITNSKAIVLCDDLTSELDQFHSKALIKQLTQLEGQTFVTGINLNVLMDQNHRMFHMEHGAIQTDYT